MIWVVLVLVLVGVATAVHHVDRRMRVDGRRVLDRGRFIADGWELPAGIDPEVCDFFARNYFDVIRGRVLPERMTWAELRRYKHVQLITHWAEEDLR